MKRVFVDTGAWIAAIERGDRHHDAAAAHLENLVRRRTPLMTTNYVVSETATRLRYDSGLPTALKFREQLVRASTGGRIAIEWIDESAQEAGWAILERYADVGLSMTDATSAAVARANKVSTVFGFDADFRALGFDVQPAV